MSSERLDALLDAWLEERARAGRLELRCVSVELAAFHILEALTATSFTPTPAIVAAITELETILRDG